MSNYVGQKMFASCYDIPAIELTIREFCILLSIINFLRTSAKIHNKNNFQFSVQLYIF